jgi:hypothetical protein
VPETGGQHGDPERRFRALYTAYYPAMLSYAIRRTDRSDDALAEETVAVGPLQAGNNRLPAGTVMQYTLYLHQGLVGSLSATPAPSATPAASATS